MQCHFRLLQLVALLSQPGLQPTTCLLLADQRHSVATQCPLHCFGQAPLVVALLLPAGQLAGCTAAPAPTAPALWTTHSCSQSCWSRSLCSFSWRGSRASRALYLWHASSKLSRATPFCSLRWSCSQLGSRRGLSQFASGKHLVTGEQLESTGVPAFLFCWHCPLQRSSSLAGVA